MKAVKIFSYNGCIGIESDVSAEGYFNDPSAEGQMGLVTPPHMIEITSEAKEMLRTAPRDRGTFAPIMLTRHDPSIHEEHGSCSIGILGFHKHLITFDDGVISRNCDVTVLDELDVNDDIEIPQEFKDVVDGNN